MLLPPLEVETPGLPRRYLLPFDPHELPHHFIDVLVIGGGVAGLRFALEFDESTRVLVVTKDQLRESNSAYAQGGIAGVMDPEDHFEDHIADTISAGKGLCDVEVVSDVVREAPNALPSLPIGGFVSTSTTAPCAGSRGGAFAQAGGARTGRRHGQGGDARRRGQSANASEYSRMAK